MQQLPRLVDPEDPDPSVRVRLFEPVLSEMMTSGQQ